MANALETAIINAYHNNSKVKESFTSNKPSWWNGELDKLKNAWIKIVRKHNKIKGPDNKATMDAARSAYEIC